ncbi:hypothetical protein HME9302_01674 [Alteripontixanthobacter maritimus]|uniref:BioF2-like acetyltransferase domain-containing protein n=1 Tax=Alteripontixanthobacter maritimus TaxID=2161824 RepID=A0A369QB73_9SPHN|nr:GNAT family N-acetyltransferase [Alteripontixanthobacter maritimus]RDC60467.1 hypothetical protein HME9302_01674 [Alteripontixanthobacter maritimus]
MEQTADWIAATGDGGVMRVVDPDLLRSNAFRAEWDALAANASEPNPFFESWYLLPSLDLFDVLRKTRILALYNNDGGSERLVGLFPVGSNFDYYGYRLPHLFTWSHANIFLGTPLVAAGFEHAFWGALLDWADRNAALALFLHCPDIPADGPIFAALRDVAIRHSRPAAIVQSYERALLKSDDDAESYFAASVNGKRRKEFRRRAKRFAEGGEVSLEQTRGDEGISDWLKEFLALEQAGWKGDEASALACCDKTTALFRQTMMAAANLGRLDRVTLRLDGKMVAGLLTVTAGSGAFSYKTAYDEAHAKASPGVMLQRHYLETLADPVLDWTDSCAAPDHPMIDHFWRERRPMVRVSIPVGGSMRQAIARGIIRQETGRPVVGALDVLLEKPQTLTVERAR